MIQIIAAISKNRVLGKDNKLLWRLSNDLKRFKEITTGHTVVMGRKTFESIGRPLPQRRNIIVSRNEDLVIEGVEVVSSLEEAFLLTGEDCFVIGGGEIYKQALEFTDKLYLTIVDCEIEGDTFFPEIDSSWVKITEESFDSDEKNEWNYTFVEYEKYQF